MDGLYGLPNPAAGTPVTPTPDGGSSFASAPGTPASLSSGAVEGVTAEPAGGISLPEVPVATPPPVSSPSRVRALFSSVLGAVMVSMGGAFYTPVVGPLTLPGKSVVKYQLDFSTPTSWLVIGNSALGLSEAGSTTNFYDSTGRYLKYTVTGVLGGIYVTPNYGIGGGNPPVSVLIKVRTGASGDLPGAANDRWWNGLASNSLYGSDNPTTLSVAAFRYCPNVDGTAFFRAYTANGTSSTVTITTVPIVANQVYNLQIDLDGTLGRAVFSINGVVVAVHTTTLPLSSSTLQISTLVSNPGGTAAKHFLSSITIAA
jgi:hypothetical protein